MDDIKLDFTRIAAAIDVLLNGSMTEETQTPFVLILCEEEATRPGATLVKATVLSNMPGDVAHEIMGKALAAEAKRFNQ